MSNEPIGFTKNGVPIYNYKQVELSSKQAKELVTLGRVYIKKNNKQARIVKK